MYRPLFPQQPLIRWFAYVEPSGRSRAEDFLEKLPNLRRAALEARMLAWAVHGNWDAEVKYIHQMHVKSKIALYEIKVSEERLFFIRCNNDAVAIGGLVKKVRWSKKEQATLDAMAPLIDAAAGECLKGRKV